MIERFVYIGWTTMLWCLFGFCFTGDLKSGTAFFDQQ